MWNDKETDVDLLGYKKIAETVIEIINDNHLRPLTIGVYGDWGVGKSSVLSLIKKKIKESNDQGIAKTHCILFNGWLFQGYEDVKTALMETIISELAILQPRHKKVQKLAVSLLKRVNWLKVAKVSASTLFTGLTGIPDPGALGGLVSLLKKGKNLLQPRKEESDTDGINVNVEEKDDDSFIKEFKEATITGQIHAFRSEFKELIKTSKIDHVVVLVDDLDRCLPRSVIDILEAIRLFLFVEGTTFVLSADEKMIEYAVREHFPNLPASYSEYTRSYLEKLIQIPIRIPMLNGFQTGNYIKFLLLQNYLKHDYSRLEAVYELYSGKMKNPYDTINLSYQIITEALGTTVPELQESILIGDQLSPTLSVGLKGNPRNTKRFLNTLFLRMRIARIYGLESAIQLNALAKLMLLERFQPDKFDDLVSEVSSSSDGLSPTLFDSEERFAENLGKSQTKKSVDSEQSDQKFSTWISLEPQLAKIDLRPYVFISKEKAISFDSDSGFPTHLTKLLEQLNTTSSIASKAAERELKALSISEATLLFEKLENESRSTDLKSLPPSIMGLLKIAGVHTDLEERLVKLMGTYPSTNLGPWAVVQLTGLSNPKAVEAFKLLLKNWSEQDSNKILKSTAAQTLKSL